jgi:hypothetical protein
MKEENIRYSDTTSKYLFNSIEKFNVSGEMYDCSSIVLTHYKTNYELHLI